jgi:hypothetical protein
MMRDLFVVIFLLFLIALVTAFVLDVESGNLTAAGVVVAGADQNNRISFTGAGNGSGPTIASTGTSDAAVSIKFRPKGTGILDFPGVAFVASDGSVIGAAIRSTPGTFASFAACTLGVNGTEGYMAAITDSPTNAWGAAITVGGSTNHVLAYCDGNNWTVVGK